MLFHEARLFLCILEAVIRQIGNYIFNSAIKKQFRSLCLAIQVNPANHGLGPDSHNNLEIPELLCEYRI